MIPIAALIAGVLVLFLVKHLFINNSYEKVLLNVALEINNDCPVMIDEDTRLDSAKVQHQTLKYYYTMVKVLKDSIDVQSLKENLEPVILQSVKTNPELKLYRDNKVTMIYHYSDKAGAIIMEIEITPYKYKNE
ncbi:MAG: hypothetical protein PHS30_03210 [Bacteroidales bacterium]|nr:hypothetical protein [Bacteroidales bacterium]